MTTKRKLRIGLGGVALLTVAIGLVCLPDIVRYLKIERM
jgi:hypothetical protein